MFGFACPAGPDHGPKEDNTVTARSTDAASAESAGFQQREVGEERGGETVGCNMTAVENYRAGTDTGDEIQIVCGDKQRMRQVFKKFY